MRDNLSVELDDDFFTIIVCAIRYALGRRTYMPSLVCGYAKQYIQQIPTKDLYVISRDIREHGSRSYGAEAYGDECDLKTWMNFLEAVETEYKTRSDKTAPIPE